MDISGFLEEWNNASDTVLVHTSGSTGTPKPMLAPKAGMLASARITCDFLGLKKGDRALLCLPLDYIAGKMMVVRSLERGLELVSVTPGNHPFASLPDGEPPFDLVAMVPSQVYCSLSVERERAMLMSSRNLIIGGGAVSDALASELASFPNAVWSTYGMTETLSHIALRRLSGPQRSGWYTPFDTVELSSDSDGCLVIDAPSVHETILKTNDIVEFHPDGRRFRVLGRKDNVICSGGIKLQIETIEEKLRPFMRVPFCITKKPDEKFGEKVVLLVEKQMPGIEAAIAALDKYSRPKEIVVVDSIPLTPTGKIDRKKASFDILCPSLHIDSQDL